MVPEDAGPTEIVRSVWESGRARWPELDLPFERFAELVSPHLPDESDGNGQVPAHVHAADLVLVAACLAGVPGAAQVFDRYVRSDIDVAIARIERRPHIRHELTQELLVALFVGDRGSGPRLRGYSGRGPLRAWVRMAAVRRALNAARDATRHARLEARLMDTMVVQGSLDPALALVKAEHQEEFARAFRDSLAGLDVRERTLLRLHYGEGVHLGGIAGLHGWSKATASRRLAAARQELLAGAEARLRQRLRLSPSELKSLLRVLRSGLGARLSGLRDPDRRHER